MNIDYALSKLTPPGQPRKGIWNSGILQIMTGRACDKSCVHCSQGSNLGGRLTFMTPDEFEAAVKSLGFGVPGQTPYFGIVGCFGGNAALSPHFGAYCEILRKLVPLKQRGLWCNHPRGKGALCRITFWPGHSNLNCHLDREAYDEFCRDWPESIPYLKGMDQDSIHGAPFVAIKDVEPDEEKRWAMIADCDVSRWWSGAIGSIPGRGLRAYACELAFAQANLHCNDPDWPDVGMEVVPGWWQRPMTDFAAQVNLHCQACGIPARRTGRSAMGAQVDEFSETHRSIARPKVRDRPVEFVELGGMIERSNRPSTEYLKGTTPGYRGE